MGSINGTTKESLPVAPIEVIGIEVFDPETGLSISQPVSFAISFGDLCVITGPNGVGKSTMLQGIATMLNSKEPAARLRGVVQTKFDSTSGNRLQVRLHPQLSAPMFALPLCLGDVLNWYLPEREPIPDLVKDLDLLRPWDSASGGEKQRVLLAGIFTESNRKSKDDEAEILLLDEPGNHLDSKNREELHTQVRLWLASSPRRSIVLVTHDPKSWNPSVLVELAAVEK